MSFCIQMFFNSQSAMELKKKNVVMGLNWIRILDVENEIYLLYLVICYIIIFYYWKTKSRQNDQHFSMIIFCNYSNYSF